MNIRNFGGNNPGQRNIYCPYKSNNMTIRWIFVILVVIMLEVKF